MQPCAPRDQRGWSFRSARQSREPRYVASSSHMHRGGLLGLCLASRALAFTGAHAARASLRASKLTSPALGPQSPPLGSRRATVRLMSTSTDLTSQIEATISENKVVVYSKSYCPFCAKTKDIFDSLQVRSVRERADDCAVAA